MRNPWDRFVSIACYFDIPVNELSAHFNRYQKRQALREHSLPLVSYTHCDGQPFVDFIGRFENLQADFDRVCERIGLRRTRLPHASRTDHEHYSRYFDSRAMHTVARLYAQDVEAFGYSFDRQ